VINVATKILYRGHKGEHREYYICSYCGTAFYDNTFIPHNITEVYSTLCPVCGVLVMNVNKEKFELYIKAHNDLAESISTDGCTDRMPDETEK
jgi:DNA-directed RNA polymerase subunit RPC12/RpoP